MTYISLTIWDVAAVSVFVLMNGLLSLWLLVTWLERGRFQYFAAWCIPAGIAVIIWQLVN